MQILEFIKGFRNVGCFYRIKIYVTNSEVNSISRLCEFLKTSSIPFDSLHVSGGRKRSQIFFCLLVGSRHTVHVRTVTCIITHFYIELQGIKKERRYMSRVATCTVRGGQNFLVAFFSFV